MSDPQALEPCPFCGAALVVTRGFNPNARCETDGCWMNERRISISTEVPAQVAAWNRRTPTAALQALADELATFLTDEEHGSDGMSGDDAASNLGGFIMDARELSSCRPKRHSRSCDCGACPETA